MTRDWVDLRIAETASLSGSAVRATMATSAPEAANRAATARPIPLLPPVTIAARCERLISITSSQTRVSAVPHSKAILVAACWYVALMHRQCSRRGDLVINSPSIPASVNCWQELGHPLLYPQ